MCVYFSFISPFPSVFCVQNTCLTSQSIRCILGNYAFPCELAVFSPLDFTNHGYKNKVQLWFPEGKGLVSDRCILSHTAVRIREEGANYVIVSQSHMSQTQKQ